MKDRHGRVKRWEVIQQHKGFNIMYFKNAEFGDPMNYRIEGLEGEYSDLRSAVSRINQQ